MQRPPAGIAGGMRHTSTQQPKPMRASPTAARVQDRHWSEGDEAPVCQQAGLAQWTMIDCLYGKTDFAMANQSIGKPARLFMGTEKSLKLFTLRFRPKHGFYVVQVKNADGCGPVQPISAGRDKRALPNRQYLRRRGSAS